MRRSPDSRLRDQCTKPTFGQMGWELVNATPFSPHAMAIAAAGLRLGWSDALAKLLFLMLSVALAAQEVRSSCANCAVWNKPQQAFKIYRETPLCPCGGGGGCLGNLPT